jgi:hypothetical protein
MRLLWRWLKFKASRNNVVIYTVKTKGGNLKYKKQKSLGSDGDKTNYSQP